MVCPPWLKKWGGTCPPRPPPNCAHAQRPTYQITMTQVFKRIFHQWKFPVNHLNIKCMVSTYWRLSLYHSGLPRLHGKSPKRTSIAYAAVYRIATRCIQCVNVMYTVSMVEVGLSARLLSAQHHHGCWVKPGYRLRCRDTQESAVSTTTMK